MCASWPIHTRPPPLSFFRSGCLPFLQAELQPVVDTLKFSDIFETASPVDGKCPEGFKGTPRQECLKLKPGREKHAAFFETRRYAAYVGATTEFTKWEGITYDAQRARLYTAISSQRGGMTDESAVRTVGEDVLKLPDNSCGCVYYMDVVRLSVCALCLSV